MPESLHELAYKEALRGLGEQWQALESLRSRAGVLLSSATLSTAFFGGQALNGRVSNAVVAVAMALFVGVGVCVTAILWPKRGWLFSVPASEFVTDTDPHPVSDPEVAATALVRITDRIEDHAKANRRRLEQLFVLFALGCVMFLAEIVVWLTELLTH